VRNVGGNSHTARTGCCEKHCAVNFHDRDRTDVERKPAVGEWGSDSSLWIKLMNYKSTCRPSLCTNTVPVENGQTQKLGCDKGEILYCKSGTAEKSL